MTNPIDGIVWAPATYDEIDRVVKAVLAVACTLARHAAGNAGTILMRARPACRAARVDKFGGRCREIGPLGAPNG